MPGTHVRQDLAGILSKWRQRQSRPIRRLPFLGAWSVWQQALLEEWTYLGGAPMLLHHPVETRFGQRYLDYLRAISGARLVSVPYRSSDLNDLILTLQAASVTKPWSPLALALAANRLTDQLPNLLGPPLAQRPRFQRVLVETLTDLP